MRETVCNFSDRDIFLLTDHRIRRTVKNDLTGVCIDRTAARCNTLDYSQYFLFVLHLPVLKIFKKQKGYMRNTDNRKGDSVRIRLTEAMRDYIDKKSKITGKTISEIFRDYIVQDMHKHKV